MGHAERISSAVDAARDRAWATECDEWSAHEEAEASAYSDALAIVNCTRDLAHYLRERGDYLDLATGEDVRIGGPKFSVYDAALIACVALPAEGRECIAASVHDELCRRIAADLVSRVS